jgi:hypothetical protein
VQVQVERLGAQVRPAVAQLERAEIGEHLHHPDRVAHHHAGAAERLALAQQILRERDRLLHLRLPFPAARTGRPTTLVRQMKMKVNFNCCPRACRRKKARRCRGHPRAVAANRAAAGRATGG